MYPKKPLVMGNHRRDVEAIEEFGYMVSLDGKLYGVRKKTEIKKQNILGYDTWQISYKRGLSKARTVRANIGTYSSWTGDRDTEGYNIHHIDHCNTNNYFFNLLKMSEREHIAYHSAFDRLSNITQVSILKLLNRMVNEACDSEAILESYEKLTHKVRNIIDAVIASKKTGVVMWI